MEEEKNSSNNDALDLEAEASEIRREKLFRSRKSGKDSGIVTPPGGVSLWRIVSAVTAIAVVLAAVVLLAVPGLRTGIVEQAAGVFLPGPDNTLYELPAPPPKAPRVTESFQESGGFDPESGIMYSGETAQPEKIEPFGGEKKEAVKLPRTPGSRGAFALMQEDDGPLGKLLEGESGGLEYKTWNLVSQTPPVYLLDIIAVPAEGEEELHLIFSVDMGKKEITPLSQAARDFMKP